VVSVGSSGDLREILPVMVAAAEPYWGADTGKAVLVSLQEGDERIGSVRGDTTGSTRERR
jgi:hypothetical protein